MANFQIIICNKLLHLFVFLLKKIVRQKVEPTRLYLFYLLEDVAVESERSDWLSFILKSSSK